MKFMFISERSVLVRVCDPWACVIMWVNIKNGHFFVHPKQFFLATSSRLTNTKVCMLFILTLSSIKRSLRVNNIIHEDIF